MKSKCQGRNKVLETECFTVQRAAALYYYYYYHYYYLPHSTMTTTIVIMQGICNYITQKMFLRYIALQLFCSYT
jgi:hypothetical protein